MNYYELLGVSLNATEKEIKTAYRKLALQFHPDRNPGDPSAEVKFKQIQEAYENLIDVNKRARYNAKGPQPKPQSKPKPKPKAKPPFEANEFKSRGFRIYDAPPPPFDLWGNRITPEDKWKDSFSGRYESGGSPDLR